MARRPIKTTVTGPKRVLRPRNAAARVLRDPVFRPRVAKNPNAYTRKGRKPKPTPDGDQP